MPDVGVFAAIFDEQQRILCVRLNYGPRYWTAPGGKVEPHESLADALEREILEETGHRCAIGELIGVYSAPVKDDLVIFFEAHILETGKRVPDGEIAEVGFFARDALPEPFSPRMAVRIEHAFQGKRGVAHTFDS